METKPSANCSTSRNTAREFDQTTRQLLQRAVNERTLKKYLFQFEELVSFGRKIGTEVKLPVPTITITRYISYLYNKGHAWTTIRTYLSAINFVHKIKGYDPVCNSPVINYMKAGIQKEDRGKALLRPITKPLLNKIIYITENCMENTWFQKILIKACFLLMYYGCLRVGEISISNSNEVNILRKSQITVISSKNLEISFHSYKHSRGKTPSIVIRAQNGYCPVEALKKYMDVRNEIRDNPMLFIDQERKTITREWLVRYLKTELSILGEDPSQYNTHSFRIGRTTDLYRSGVSERIIKAAGRWKTDAFRQYIRMDKITLP